MEDHNNLWTGGLWEQPNPQYPLPPPVVIPERKEPESQTLTPTQKKLSLRAKRHFSLALGLIALLVGVSVVRETREQITFSMPGIFGFGQDGNNGGEAGGTEDKNDEPPTIRSAPLDSQVNLPFTQNQLFPLTPQEIYEQNQESIVLISAQRPGQASTATGVVMTKDGYIITNAHVVAGASTATVTLWNNEKYSAQLVGYDFPQDLAVLKILAYNLKPAEFADSDLMTVGDTCYAIGNPLGTEYRSSFTDGMVSAVDRVLEVSGNNMVLLQTNTALNTGNSGGALLNEYGQVVGITTIKLMSEKDTIEGMGFAIPSKRVKQVVDRLIQGEDVSPSSIGIEAKSVTSPVMGVKVEVVTRSSNVYDQGMRAGDIILSANGRTVKDVADLNREKGYLFPGDLICYEVYRDGETLEITAELQVK